MVLPPKSTAGLAHIYARHDNTSVPLWLSRHLNSSLKRAYPIGPGLSPYDFWQYLIDSVHGLTGASQLPI